MHVNDHGNMTLYVANGRGKLRSVGLGLIPQSGPQHRMMFRMEHPAML